MINVFLGCNCSFVCVGVLFAEAGTFHQCRVKENFLTTRKPPRSPRQQLILDSLWFDPTRPSRFRKQRRANEGCGQVKLPAELLTYKHGNRSTVIVFAEGIVHPKLKICCKCIHNQAIQDVDAFDFIRTDLEKCYITSLAHQWMLCSEWVPSE